MHAVSPIGPLSRAVGQPIREPSLHTAISDDAEISIGANGLAVVCVVANASDLSSQHRDKTLSELRLAG